MLEVKSAKVETRKSAKTGKDYSVLVIEFQGGYTFTPLLSNEQVFILESLSK